MIIVNTVLNCDKPQSSMQKKKDLGMATPQYVWKYTRETRMKISQSATFIGTYCSAFCKTVHDTWEA